MKTMRTIIRKEFPILTKSIRGQQLVYLDNAATTQKPNCVMQAMQDYYREWNANVHRGVHTLSEKATELFEESRKRVQAFINAKQAKECIFTKGTTEAINLLAYSFGEKFVFAGDEILISAMEHHSNIVPWQMLCERKKAHLKYIPMNERGELLLDKVDALLTEKTKIVAVTQVSNALGTINPIKQIIEKAHQKRIPVLIDGAQAAPHLPIDVQDLDCDFFAFSSHKMYGPTGIAVLYGKAHLLDSLPPYQGGGEMILKVSLTEGPIYNDLPFKFEAGTPPIAQAIGFSAALEFLDQIGMEDIGALEKPLMSYLTESLLSIPNLRILGTAAQKVGVVSFVMEGVHPHDIGTIVDQSGVAIRTGHHCAMPVMDFFKVPATARVSLGIYNTEEDIDQLIKALKTVRSLFGKRMVKIQQVSLHD